MDTSSKLYTRQFITRLALFIITLGTAIVVTRLTPWYNSNWDNTILLLPVFPGIYSGLYLARTIVTLDEMQQRIQLEAFSFSLANTAFVALVLGLLQFNTSGSINFIWVIPIMAGFWILGLRIARRRYQ